MGCQSRPIRVGRSRPPGSNAGAAGQMPPPRSRAGGETDPSCLPASVDSSNSTNTAGGGGTRMPYVAARPSWGVNERPPHRTAPHGPIGRPSCVPFPPPKQNPTDSPTKSHSQRPEGGMTYVGACPCPLVGFAATRPPWLLSSALRFHALPPRHQRSDAFGPPLVRRRRCWGPPPRLPASALSN